MASCNNQTFAGITLGLYMCLSVVGSTALFIYADLYAATPREASLSKAGGAFLIAIAAAVVAVLAIMIIRDAAQHKLI